jgi:hypothetical protein
MLVNHIFSFYHWTFFASKESGSQWFSVLKRHFLLSKHVSCSKIFAPLASRSFSFDRCFAFVFFPNCRNSVYNLSTLQSFVVHPVLALYYVLFRLCSVISFVYFWLYVLLFILILFGMRQQFIGYKCRNLFLWNLISILKHCTYLLYLIRDTNQVHDYPEYSLYSLFEIELPVSQLID